MKKIIIGCIVLSIIVCGSSFVQSRVKTKGYIEIEKEKLAEKKSASYKLENIVNKKTEKNATYKRDKWNYKGTVKFPINESSDKWKKFKDHNEMVEACTLPDDIIISLTTEELIELVITYPLASDLYAYNSFEEGLYNLAENFNGLRELLKRRDKNEKLIEFYQNLDFSKVGNNLKEKDLKKLNEMNRENIIDYSESTEEIMKMIISCDIIESILTNDIFLDSASGSQKRQLAYVAEEKMKEKEQNKIARESKYSIYSKAQESGNLSSLGTIEDQSGVQSNKVFGSSFTTVKTPKGTKVSVIGDPYMGNSWATYVTNDFKMQYPKATVLSQADNRYNCHSYAWYYASTNNVYWMNDPSAYIKDGSYKNVGAQSNRRVDNRITWTSPAIIHSGILKGINADGTYSIYSKWGAGPLMRHTAKYSPYGGTRTYYKRS